MSGVDLILLQQELAAAGYPYTGLSAPDNNPMHVQIYDDEAFGMVYLAVVDPGTEPTLLAHNPPPPVIEFSGALQVSSIVRTTDDTITQVFKLPTKPKHIYRCTVRLTAVDAGNGTCKDAEARILFKRLAANVVQVGNTVVISVMQDTQAQTWNIVPGVSGTDFIISVRGAVGRTIDWLLFGDVGTYAPEGLL